jgi:hypothetical protein
MPSAPTGSATEPTGWWPGKAAARSLRPTCRRSAWAWRASRPGCRWTRSPRPYGPAAVVRVPGGRPVPEMGDPLGADLPGGERRNRDPPGGARRCPRVDGFARMAPEELIREDELEVGPLLQLGLSTGVLDLAWLIRMGRAYAEGLRLAAKGRERGLPGAVHRAGAGVRRRPADGHGAGLPAGKRLPAAGGPRAHGHLPQAAGGGRTWSRTSRPSWNGPACWRGRSGSRRWTGPPTSTAECR